MKSLIPLILLTLLIRLPPVFSNSISFHYDMARDAFVARDMLAGDLKVVGPPSSSPHLFHGVLYYYLLAVGYFFAGGNPAGVALIFTIVSSLSCIPMFLLARDFFHSARKGIIAAIMFALSFEASQYGPWLSNPSLALPVLGWYFYGLWVWRRGSPRGFLLSILAATLATQFQLFLGVLFVNICLFWLIYKPRVSQKYLTLSGLIILLGLASYVFSYLKTNSLSALLGIFNSSNQFVFRIQFTDVLLVYVNRFADIYINNFVPTNVFIGGVLSLVCFAYSLRHRFLIFTLLTNLPLFFFGGHNSSYVNVGLIFPAILSVVGIFQKRPVLLGLFVTSNLVAIVTNASRGQLALVIPKDMILQSQLALIDQTYVTAAGQPFSINSTTLPLWTNTTWAYLYAWYGQAKYGYVPDYYGHDQIGQPGAEILPHTISPQPLAFYIIDPPDGIEPQLLAAEQASENGHTLLQQEYHYGQLTLQARTPWPK